MKCNGKCCNKGTNSFHLNEEDVFQTKSSNAAVEPSNSSSLVTISPQNQKLSSQVLNQTQELKMADIKMIQAFGVPLLNSDGFQRQDMWDKIWERITRLRGKLYTLPGGAIAKQFISIYEKEIDAFSKGDKKSEVFICFPSLILQKDKNIKKTKDIRILLKRRLQMWTNGFFENLCDEAERCDKKLPKSSGKMSEDQEEKIFSALILQGRLREAVRFITDRQGGGAMAPEDDAVKPFGKSVLEVLIDKHPEQRIPEVLRGFYQL